MTLEKLISEGKCRLEYWGSNLRMSGRQGEFEDHEFKWGPSLHSWASVSLMPLTGVLFSRGPYDISVNGQCLTSQLLLVWSPYPTTQIKVINILLEGPGVLQAISCTIYTGKRLKCISGTIPYQLLLEVLGTSHMPRP